MSFSRIIPFLAASTLLSGCSAMSENFSDSAAERTAVATGAGAGAAGIGYALSNGDAKTTALAGVGGAAVAMALQGDDSEYGRKMMAKGVEVGTQIEAKRLYFAMLNASTAPRNKSNQQLRYYDIVIPARKIDGIEFKAERIQVPVFDSVTPYANGAIGNPALNRMVDGQTDVIRENPDALAGAQVSAPVMNESSAR